MIKSLTLNSYQGILFQRFNRFGTSPWLIPIGLYHRNRKRPGLQFCPLCLSEDIIPYFRKFWRLSIVCLCPKHGCILRDTCSECGSPVAFHRNYMGNKNTIPVYNITQCHNCHADLRSNRVRREISGLPLKWVNLYKRMLAEFIDRKWINLPSSSIVYPHLFYDGVKVLIAVLKSNCAKKAKDSILNNFKFDIRAYFPENLRQLEFNRVSVIQRLAVLALVAFLLNDWPINLKAIELSKSMFKDHNHELPYWIYRLFYS